MTQATLMTTFPTASGFCSQELPPAPSCHSACSGYCGSGRKGRPLQTNAAQSLLQVPGHRKVGRLPCRGDCFSVWLLHGHGQSHPSKESKIDSCQKAAVQQQSRPVTWNCSLGTNADMLPPGCGFQQEPRGLLTAWHEWRSQIV